MKIDKRKNYYIVLDTEGLGLNDKKNKVYGRQRSYDIGYVITDKKGNLIKMFNALTKEIFGDDDLMSTAYFADKIPLYDYMIDNKEIKVKLFHNIVREIKKDLKELLEGIMKGLIEFYNDNEAKHFLLKLKRKHFRCERVENTIKILHLYCFNLSPKNGGLYIEASGDNEKVVYMDIKSDDIKSSIYFISIENC